LEDITEMLHYTTLYERREWIVSSPSSRGWSLPLPHPAGRRTAGMCLAPPDSSWS